MLARLEFKRADCWIGWYGPIRTSVARHEGGWEWRYTDLWLCLVPMVPLHLRWGPGAAWDR
jgi:hypothetical protein